LNGLHTRNGRESSKEFFQSGVAFNVFDQSLNWNTSTLEAGNATEPFGIDPDKVIEMGSVRPSYLPNLRESCAERKPEPVG